MEKIAKKATAEKKEVAALTDADITKGTKLATGKRKVITYRVMSVTDKTATLENVADKSQKMVRKASLLKSYRRAA